ncbi:pilus assembly protein [Hydrogenophaga atypica]|uniref:Pilus assembly protein n=1 Tax=Hydrogenophaga atypica TaxID=249409 RepID=A0ABW2QF07_9BURK
MNNSTLFKHARSIMKLVVHDKRSARLGLRALCGATVLGILSVVGAPAHADETEIFRASFDTSGARPKVLIVFDNSGSMDTKAQNKPAYDPSQTYPNVGNIQSGRLYWADGNSGNPPSASTSQWFNQQKNRCGSSYTPLAQQGFYINRWARWNTSSSSGWSEGLDKNRQDPLHVECRQDVVDSNNDNGTGTSNPGNGYPRSSTPRPYGSNRQTSVDDDWDSTQRVYTANYMNWHHSTELTDRSRMDVARTVISSIIQANPGIDFGLAVFNDNASTTYNGGRIVRRIIENSTDAQRTALVNMVNGLSPDTWTPLCESMYEAYRYLSGSTLVYGNRSNGNDGPVKDSAAESPSGTYASPAGDCQYLYVILMTDGEPTYDTSANSAIETLTGKTCKSYADGNGGTKKNCLPVLTEHMYTQDLDGNASNGTQKAITYTIGFATNQTLLSDAAANGGGKYYTAYNTEELTSAFQGAITDILSTSSSFTSPAVAVDSFSRTQSLDSVFLAMFLPKATTDWPGNIKKIKVAVNASGVASYVDANGVAALDNATGQLKTSAVTFWGTTQDGPVVNKGGVGDLLLARDMDGRVIKFDNAAGNLADLTTSGVTATNFGVANDAALFSAFGVSSQTELNDLLAWARGWTSSAKTSKRAWVMGDILNSRPVAINYGARGSYTQSNPDLRLIVGTNAGFLHMFSGDTGAESWAFMPRPMARIQALRQDNAESVDAIYGVDAPPVVYRHDANSDGTIKASDNDKVYAFLGLRRGGRALYALDLTNPDSPAFMWKIDNTTTGFSELGQTWSVPTVTRVKGHTNPVLVFAAGYDTSFDDKTTLASGTSAAMGRGIYVVDAVTGALLWSATPGAASTKNKQVSAFTYPMPAPVTVMDSNGDGYADRIYIADVGGNIWRVDLAGDSIPSTDHSAWRVLQMAELAEANHAGDRRFFSAVEVARAVEGTTPFDALMLGSGDRSNPNATDNSDRLYMVRDYKTGIYTTNPPSKPCAVPSSDPRCVLPVTHSNLYNASANLIQVGSETEKVAAKSTLDAAAGWYVNLTAASGEKSLATSRTIAGTVYFTTFSPGGSALSANQCVPTAGTSRLYALNMFDASAKLDFNGSNSLTLSDRSVVTGSMITDTPSIYAGPDRVIQLMLPPGSVPKTTTPGTIFGGGFGRTAQTTGLQTKIPRNANESYVPGRDSGRYWYLPDRR